MMCIETVGAPGSPYGYRYVRVGPGKAYSIAQHRAAFEQTWGITLRADQVVRHACDNGRCVNPLHLMIGTQGDNNRDTRQRGRQWWRGQCKRGHDLAITGVPCNGGKWRRCGVCKKERRSL